MSTLSILTESTNSFRGEKPEETTLLISRKHWIFLAKKIVVCFFLAAMPFTAHFFIKSKAWYSSFSDIFWFLTILYLLILWNLIFYAIMVYFLNTIIVTNKRVIDNQQNGFFKYTLNELERDKIQDITVKMNGMTSSILNYGDLEIQSAGAQNKFFFYSLPSPKKIKDTIMN